MNFRAARPALCGLVLTALVACTSSAPQRSGATASSAAPALPAVTACGAPVAFTENFVRVELAPVRTAEGARFLRGRFTPERPGDHLYSKDLPADGIDGAGRPTRLWLEPAAAAGPAAALLADQPLHDLAYPGFSRPFPVYPDGPVELRLPFTAPANDQPVTVHASYMACSSTGSCLPPVDDHAVPLTLPARCP